jgi:hypothetical protein
VLAEASVAEMQRQQFAQSEAVPGVTFGFFENVTRGERALVHAGGIRGFMSGVCLWPRQRLGLFVSNNGYSGTLVQSFLAAFVKHYFHQAPGERDGRAANPARDLERFAGPYRAASATRGNLEKAGSLLAGDVEIRAAGGYVPHLNFGGDWFLPTGRLDFLLDRGDEPLAFREDERGEVRLLVTTSPLIGCEVFERVPWYQTARLHRELLLLFCASFLSVVLAPLCARVLPRIPRLEAWIPAGARAATFSQGRWARAALFVVAGLNVVFLVLLVAGFRLARDTGVLYGIPPLVRFDLMLPLAAALLSVVLPFCAWRAWREGYWSRLARVHYTWCAFAAVAFVPFLRYWKLL